MTREIQMKNKYILTEESIKVGKKNLYRIKAIKDFGNVKEGEIGGFVESEKNLSQDGNAWIYDDAWVHGNAEVSGDAQVFDATKVSGDAKVSGKANVFE